MTTAPDDTDTMAEGVRRSDGVTLWRRIADEIGAAIARGDYPRGQRLPTEHDLAARFGVNRHTIRRAFAMLAEQGLVRATQGSGTYVEHRPLSYPVGPQTRFSEIVAAQAREPGGELVAAGLEDCDAVVAAALALTPGTKVLRMESLRRADGAPICLATSWFPADRVPDFQLVFAATQSITRALATFGITHYRRVTTKLTGTIATRRDETLLDLAPGRPVLVLESVNADAAGRPIQFSRSRFAADRVAIEWARG